MTHCIQLSSGTLIPRLGLGTCLGKDVTARGVSYTNIAEKALFLGYRHFDCAQLYGTQPAVGEALIRCFKNKLLAREDIFIATKVWNTHHSRKRVLESVTNSLSELQLEYLDLCIIHWPQGYKETDDTFFPFDTENNVAPSDVDYVETYRALEECVTSGKVKSIGVSNFNIQQLKRLLQHCAIRPAVLQIEVNPYISQVNLKQFCHEESIIVVAYSPLGNPGRPTEDCPPGCPSNLLTCDLISRVAENHNKTAAQVLLRWNLQCGNVVIPKTVKEHRLKENMQVFDFELTQREMSEIDEMNIDYRGVVMEWDRNNPHYPF